MANWRKQQGQSHHQIAHSRSSSHHRKPPLDKWRSRVHQWERMFIESISSIPWETLQENQKYLYLFQNVCNWDDSAGKEAFDNAKMRYWAEINGISCKISLPDPNIFIDEVDWNASADPELVLEAEKELARVYPEECKKEDKIEIFEGTLYLNGKKLPCTGWEEDEAPVLKPSDPNSAVQSEGENLHEHYVVENGLKDFDPVEHAKKYEQKYWRNDPWNSNHREHYGGGGDWHKMGRGRNDGSYGNWETSDGYQRRREHISWSKTSPAYNGNDEYHMNKGRRSYRGGGRRGNFVYVPKEVHPTPTPVSAPAAW